MSPRTIGRHGPPPDPLNASGRKKVSRKLQPSLKARGETFLANAASTTSSSMSNEVNPRKRKLDRILPEESPKRVKPKPISSTKSPIAPKSKITSKAGPALNNTADTIAEEKRLKSYRKKAPKTFLQKLDRAQTQR
jgi:hypothetical protein